ncbi:5-(carboxyamino)imidazole ribonucleotide synthase [Aureimonas mangrovi]|uniref:5-(carboxyamino)imidazole ribonucleotide synthase n=1 Tax=Aureimonas mangrovi TaxID=2758041 RepID=UPI00163D91B3|nr:5-(carboxyamino)imidazole ribonucleotide synthase [Aureimonas mangrovi]
MPLAPLRLGGTIGIVGGGQLGRMLATAAARLGLKTVILDPQADCPASFVAARTIVASYDDRAALAELAKASGVVTYEFENVPYEPLAALAEHVPVHPTVEALAVAQDRVTEKAFLNGIGIATAPWRAVDDEPELAHALLDLGGDCIVKTRRMGYDGKGQASLRDGAPIDGVLDSLGRVPAILEKRVAFEREISVVAARAADGTVRAFDPAENVHRNGILRTSTVPARASEAAQAQAREIAGRILEKLGYIGVIGVEFFLLEGDRLLVNEIAPRVHNSGHWTEAACAASQFEQHVRAVAGWTLAAPARHSDCVMDNLIGEDIDAVPAILAEPAAVLTLYGKAETRAGRKMGHVTRLSPRADTLGDHAAAR